LDSTLTELINDLNAADQKLKSLDQNLSKQHPEYVRIEAQRKLLNEKIDNRVAGIMKRLETQVAMLRSEIDSMVESVETARRLDQEKLTKYRPYNDKKGELEDMMDSRRLLTRKINLEEMDQQLPRSTFSASTNLYRAQTLPFGPTLDVIPTVSADGYTIQMTVIPTLTEFLGYDDSKVVFPSSATNANSIGVLPLPRMRVRQASTSAIVWDGQTLVLGLGDDQLISKQSGGEIRKEKNPDVREKQLLVFITPTIVDPAGNRPPPSSKATKDEDSESFQTPTNLRPIIDRPILY